MCRACIWVSSAYLAGELVGYCAGVSSKAFSWMRQGVLSSWVNDQDCRDYYMGYGGGV